MRNRNVLILELINNPSPDSQFLQELAALAPYDDQPVVTLSRTHFLTILKQFENGSLSAPDLKAWATRLAGRKEIDFEFGPEGAVEEALFWLVFEEIHNWTSSHLCQHIEAMLERRSRNRNAS